jgi:hypothetical protein
MPRLRKGGVPATWLTMTDVRHRLLNSAAHLAVRSLPLNQSKFGRVELDRSVQSRARIPSNLRHNAKTFGEVVRFKRKRTRAGPVGTNMRGALGRREA